MKFIEVKDKDGADWLVNPDNVDALARIENSYSIHFEDDCINLTTESYIDFATAIHDDKRFAKFYSADGRGDQYINVSRIISVQDESNARIINLPTFTYEVIEPFDLIEELLSEVNE